MKRTVLCHFYNEQYLLPWWLKHHAQIFDHGIMIDYASTDDSVDLIRSICPTWTIVPSRNKFFSYHDIDREVMDLESEISGWRICLNVTEFLYGDLHMLTDDPQQQIKLPCLSMVDADWGKQFDVNLPLIGQVKTGVHYASHFGMRWARSIHNYPVYYPQGRHWFSYDTTDLVIMFMGWSPWNEQAMQRKLQILPRLGEFDLNCPQVAIQHKLTRDQMVLVHDGDWWRRSEDLSSEINRLEKLFQQSLKQD